MHFELYCQTFEFVLTVHRCLNGRALPYLSEHCISVYGADTRRHLRSANRRLYLQYGGSGSTLTAVGLFSRWPHGLELSPGFYPGPDDQCRLFETFLFARYSASSALRVLDDTSAI